jgi:hypothetical protein
MPSLNIKELIRTLEGTRSRLYSLYLAERDFGISDSLLNESIHIEQIIAQLRKLITPEQ